MSADVAIGALSQPLRAALLRSAPARGKRAQPRYVAQLRTDISRGHAKPVEMVAVVLLTAIAQGATAEQALAFPRLLHSLIETALARRDGVRVLAIADAHARAAKEEGEARQAEVRAMHERSMTSLIDLAREKREEIAAETEHLRALEHHLYGEPLKAAVGL